MERLPDLNNGALTTHNKMHIGFECGCREWRIGWLEHMFQRLMKWYDATKQIRTIVFRAITLLTNFLHQRGMDFANVVV